MLWFGFDWWVVSNCIARYSSAYSIMTVIILIILILFKLLNFLILTHKFYFLFLPVLPPILLGGGGQ